MKLLLLKSPLLLPIQPDSTPLRYRIPFRTPSCNPFLAVFKFLTRGRRRGHETHLLRGLDCNVIRVDLWGFRGHLVCSGLLEIFDCQPELDILLAELPLQKSLEECLAVCGERRLIRPRWREGLCTSVWGLEGRARVLREFLTASEGKLERVWGGEEICAWGAERKCAGKRSERGFECVCVWEKIVSLWWGASLWKGNEWESKGTVNG